MARVKALADKIILGHTYCISGKAAMLLCLQESLEVVKEQLVGALSANDGLQQQLT